MSQGLSGEEPEDLLISLDGIEEPTHLRVIEILVALDVTAKNHLSKFDTIAALQADLIAELKQLLQSR